MRETYDLLKAVIDASTAGITILDREGNVKLWSPAAERMFGWRKEEVLERPLPTVPSGRCEEHRVLRDRALAGEALGGVEVIRRKKTALRSISASGQRHFGMSKAAPPASSESWWI
ncbi:MAG: PAS domain-containing protein [Candidatus Methylomirabilis sp.]|nr:PAS domain-containing protein [Candidatus Methylomirabilis sp.]